MTNYPGKSFIYTFRQLPFSSIITKVSLSREEWRMPISMTPRCWRLYVGPVHRLNEDIYAILFKTQGWMAERIRSFSK